MTQSNLSVTPPLCHQLWEQISYSCNFKLVATVGLCLKTKKTKLKWMHQKITGFSLSESTWLCASASFSYTLPHHFISVLEKFQCNECKLSVTCFFIAQCTSRFHFTFETQNLAIVLFLYDNTAPLHPQLGIIFIRFHDHAPTFFFGITASISTAKSYMLYIMLCYWLVTLSTHADWTNRERERVCAILWGWTKT